MLVIQFCHFASESYEADMDVHRGRRDEMYDRNSIGDESLEEKRDDKINLLNRYVLCNS